MLDNSYLSGLRVSEVHWPAYQTLKSSCNLREVDTNPGRVHASTWIFLLLSTFPTISFTINLLYINSVYTFIIKYMVYNLNFKLYIYVIRPIIIIYTSLMCIKLTFTFIPIKD